MEKNYEKLKNILSQMFQLDQSDLDFGIYKIMNHKREEIEKFLNIDLLPQVKQQLQVYSSSEEKAVEEELKEIKQKLDELEIVYEDNAKYMKLKSKLDNEFNLEDAQNDVYSHLANFFSRYYKDGDFISLRRYKKDVYAIPYEGEEVKLHWANSDQYYIKTSEHFKDYSFKLDNEKEVCFRLIEAETEQDNKKEQEGKERRFIIYKEDPITISNNQLVINFEYKVNKEKQNHLVNEAVQIVSKYLNENKELISFRQLLNLAPTEKNKKRILIEKYFNDYVSRNTFDYFIHKDLGGFLKRELDFYIKNEVMFLDDINTENEVSFEKYMAKIKVIKSIGEKIITFLAQIEEFQKKLWLKKKFVYDTNYCITLDRIPDELYPKILENKEQIEEWIKLFAIDDIKGDLVNTPYSQPLTIEFLKDNPYLVLDTVFFDEDFKDEIIGQIKNLDESINGLLIHSENFQALNLLKEKYIKKVKCVYIDPPYNTKGDDFIYKDNYKESSWLSFIDNRIKLLKPYFSEGGTIAVSIDLKELDKVIMLLDSNLGADNRRANITIRRSSISGAKVINPGPVNISENVIIYSNGNDVWEPQSAYREKGYDNRYGNIIINPNEEYSNWKFSTVLEQFAQKLNIPKSKVRKELGNEFKIRLLEFAIENSNEIVQFATLDDNSISKEALEAKKISQKNKEKVIYLKRGNGNDYYLRNGKVILFYKDRLKWMGESLVPVEAISDIWDDVLPNDLHNEGGVSLRKGKKPEKLVSRIFESTTSEGDLIMDFFAGSATSGAVAIKSNRRFINVELNNYFENITLKRIKNTLNGEQSGVSKLFQYKGGGIVKYFRLESYEDTLNNLDMNLNEQQLKVLNESPDLKEKYMLSYVLEKETEGSMSLLNIDKFKNPFNYELKINKNLETRNTKIDLIETFNYLLGLVVESIERKEYFNTEGNENETKLQNAGKDDCEYVFKNVQGKTLDGEKVLIIWRTMTDDIAKDNLVLDAYFEKKRYNSNDFEYDKIYVNGDNNLPNMKLDDDMWKVILTEEEFKKRMFDIQDI